MSYVEQNLRKGEKIILNAKISKVEIVRAIAVCIIVFFIYCVSFICIAEYFIEYLAEYLRNGYWLLPEIFIEIILFYKTLSIYSIELALTNKKIIGKYGVVRTEKMNVPLEYVTAVSVEQTWFEKIFGCGSIIITTSLGNYRFDCVKSADIFKDALTKQIDKTDTREI